MSEVIKPLETYPKETRDILKAMAEDAIAAGEKELCGKCKREKVDGKCQSCGRPTKYTSDEEMEAKVDEYLNQNADEYKVIRRPYIDKEGNEKTAADVFYEVNLPTHEGFALMLGVNPTTLYEWEEEHPQFSKSLAKIKTIQKQRLINSGLSERYNSTIAKLILSANHGMAEKTATDITSKGDKVDGLAVSFVKPKE